MHNLAIALHKKGFNVTGSDDEIFEPSKGRIAKHGLLPDKFGWDESRITSDLDAVILGMHARIDNPELAKAKELGLDIFSYPEYLFEASKNKTRVVIGGSHGKTSITSMILHVLQKENIPTLFGIYLFLGVAPLTSFLFCFLLYKSCTFNYDHEKLKTKFYKKRCFSKCCFNIFTFIY